MSAVIDAAVAALQERMSGGFDGIAKFVIEGEGALMIDQNGAHAGDEDADVTLSADAETFKAILAGDLNPTMAFMNGKLTVDGNMAMAMQLGSVLS